MKKHLTLLTALIIFIVSANSFIMNKSGAPERVKIRSLSEADSLIACLNELQHSASGDQAILEDYFERSRKYYKRIEFLLEYLDPEFARQFNSPNLVKADPNVLSTEEKNPVGFQVIEELIFSGGWKNEQEQLKWQLQQLIANAGLFRKNLQGIMITDRIVFEASRMEVIKICCQGITGFDSPVCLHSLRESEAAIQSIISVWNEYASFFEDRKDQYEQLMNLMKEAENLLNNSDDYNNFDRLTFIRQYGNPIYRLMGELHLASGIEYTQQISAFNQPVNYEAMNFFERDFLNSDYYNAQKIDHATPERTILGKLLFFDPILSLDNKRACASCHQPGKAFTDGLQTSLSNVSDQFIERNAPTLLNAIFQGDFFYDVRAEFPEQQIDHVIFNNEEFNSNYETIISRLKASPEYIRYFQKAFPDMPATAIDGFTITKAMADFLRSLVALNSTFDQYMRYETDNLSDEVKQGFNLFMGKALCATCHFPPVFNGTVPPFYIETETEVLGVPATTDTLHPALDEDLGRFNIQGAPVYRYAFKTPTVRNAAQTAPYMHNGVFKTLQEVMNFYNMGGGVGLGLDVPNQTLPFDSLSLSQKEQAAIIAFMQSLTDSAFQTMSLPHLPEISGLPFLNNRKAGGDY